MRQAVGVHVDVDAGRLERRGGEDGTACDVGDEQPGADPGHLLEQHDGAAALPHHRERRHAGVPGRRLDRRAAARVVPRQGVGLEQGREARGIVLDELEQPEANVLGVLHDAGERALDGGIAGLAHGEGTRHGAERRSQRAGESRRAAAAGDAVARGEPIGELLAAQLREPLFHETPSPRTGRRCGRRA